MLSFVLSAAAGAFLASRSFDLQRELAGIAAERQPSIFYAGSSNDRDRFNISFASFGVRDAKPETPPAPAVQFEPAADIKDFKLSGTLPGAGAWIEAESGVSFILKGHEYDGYLLNEVTSDSAVLTKDGERFSLYLVFWSPPDKRPDPPPLVASAPPPAPRAARPPRNAGSDADVGVVLAEPNGGDGTINRELLNELLTNPLAEIRKMRLIPADNGMMIAGMRPDSLFLKLGMQPNDVITNINGIGIDDVGNVSNVISSMLSGTRFDFQIDRDGEPVKLGYSVK
jgi:type II secretory pathway component PulC